MYDKFTCTLNGGSVVLVDFKVKNCLSYKDETFFSMVCGARVRKLKESHTMTKGKVALLKSAFVFGPNGSGKSNLFAAFKVLRSLLFNFESLNNIHQMKLPYQPFKLGSDVEQPTQFVISLMIDEELLEFEVHYNREKICYERFSKITNAQTEHFFVRSYNKETEQYDYYTAKKSQTELIHYTRQNTSFLSILNVFNDPEAAKIFDWFMHKIIFLDEANRLASHPLIRKLEEDNFKQEVIQLLKIADFSIQDVTAKRVVRKEKNSILT